MLSVVERLAGCMMYIKEAMYISQCSMMYIKEAMYISQCSMMYIKEAMYISQCSMMYSKEAMYISQCSLMYIKEAMYISQCSTCGASLALVALGCLSAYRIPWCRVMATHHRGTPTTTVYISTIKLNSGTYTFVCRVIHLRTVMYISNM